MLRYSRLNRSIVFLLLSVLTGSGVWAQTPLARLRQVGDHYRSLKHYSTNLSVDMYSAEKNTGPERRMAGYVHVSGNLSRSLFDGKENIVGNDFVLVADHDNRTVYYAPKKQGPQKSAADGLALLDSVFLSRYTVTETKISETVHECRLLPKKAGEFKSIAIQFDRQNHTLKEITYLYATPVKYPKVVIRYADFNPAWMPDKDHYMEKQFLVGQRKTASLQPAYSSYQLINSFTYDPKKNLIEQ